MDDYGDGHQNGGNEHDFQLLSVLRDPPVNPELLATLRYYTMEGVDDNRNAFLTDLFDETDFFAGYYVARENAIYNGNINNNIDDNHNEEPNVEEDDPQSGRSRRRPREDDDEDESSSKRFRWWDEFDDTDSETDSLSEADTDANTDSDTDANTDSDTDADTDSDSDEKTGTEDDKEVSQPEEEDPIPGTSRKRLREEDDEDVRSCKQFRQTKVEYETALSPLAPTVLEGDPSLRCPPKVSSFLPPN